MYSPIVAPTPVRELAVLMAHPVTLRRLVERYETLRALHAEQDSAGTRRRLEDVTYTLCVSTGTRTADEALHTARRQIGGAPGGQ
ncbi:MULTISPECIES: DUF5133 domain-containing protein [unclassified Streptomyces]|uniref:DUF5133 domain-containing protein n=1 Tax=unclassified Streptomyces TaxID=2593676 RepID=UPI00381087AD